MVEDHSEFRVKVFKSLNFPENKSISSLLIGIGIIASSILGGFIAILETESSLYESLSPIFILISLIICSVFVLEFILRLWALDLHPKFENKDHKAISYIFSFFGMVDLISALSLIMYTISIFYSPLLDLSRIFRLMFFLKLIRYSTSFEIIWSVIKRKKEELLITLMLSLILMFFGAIFIYVAEHEAQPDVITNLFSSMWFSAINLFTIGYGEIVPLTLFGKIVSAVISILGVTLFLLPAAVIGSGFIDELEERNPSIGFCPNCNKTMQKEAFYRDIYKKRRGRIPNVVKRALEAEKEKAPPKDTLKRKIYTLLEFPFPKKLAQISVFFFFATLITLNVLAIMVETNPVLSVEMRPILIGVYIFSLIIFTIDYILRVWSCTASEEPKYQNPVKGRLRYIISPMAIADLIVVIALLLMLLPHEIVPFNRSVFLILLLCVVFKIGHFIDVFKVAGLIFKDTKREFLGAIFISLMFLVFAATALFYVERNAQPNKFSSVPATLWFGIVTFTTTGFGDMYPVTTGGRFLTVALAFLGVAFFTLPAGILGSSFFSSMREYRMHKICPECGYILSEPKLSKKRID